MNLSSYYHWHFVKTPKNLLRITSNFLFGCERFFSVPLLIKTFFAPWKRQVFEHDLGFSPGKYLEVAISNIFSRLIGAVVRFNFIVIAIFFEIIILFSGLALVIVFFCLPFITFPLFLWQKNLEEERNKRHLFLDTIQQENFTNLPPQDLNNLYITPLGKFICTRLEFTPQGNEDFKKLLERTNISLTDFIEVVRWYNHQQEETEESRKFWELSNLCKIRPLGEDFAYGYTVDLDKYSVNLINEGYNLSHLVGRRKEIEEIQRILIRPDQDNVLLVGDPGSGRHALILALALDILEGKVPEQLKHKRLIEIDLNLLISTAKTPSEIKGKVSLLLNEAVSAGNIILVIENLENFLGRDKTLPDFTDIFTQYFVKKEIQVIALTDKDSYHNLILQNGQINKIFETVSVEEISREDTLKVLEHLVPGLEQNFRLFIPYKVLTETINKSSLISQVPFPEKAIDILKEVAVLVQSNQKNLVSLPDIEKIIYAKTKIPQGALLSEEKEKLRDLENLLRKKIIGQELAIKSVSQALRRSRMDISGKERPIGTFLFSGPTGVGKTETAKALAAIYFGGEEMMVRVDMSQYQSRESIESLIGSPQTNTQGILIKAVKDHPFTVLLLDEFEKSGTDVLNIFLTVLDEGYLTDGWGKKVSFKNTIIIATSNAASEFIREYIVNQENLDLLPNKLQDYVLQKKLFSPELLNRFDGVVTFKPLTTEDLKEIAKLQLEKLNIRLKDKKISVKITPELIENIIREGFDQEFGARKMKRVIAEKVEDYLAKALLSQGDSLQGEIEIPAF